MKPRKLSLSLPSRRNIVTAGTIEKSYSLAKERYAQWGVDADAALKRLAEVAGLAAMLARRRRGRLRERRTADRRHHGHRQLSRPGAKPRRASRRRRQGNEPYPRQAALQHPCHLSGARRQEGRADRHHARAFPGLDGLGGGEEDRAGFQSDLLLPSQGRRRADARATTTRAFAASGSGTASPAARSARRSAAARERPA